MPKEQGILHLILSTAVLFSQPAVLNNILQRMQRTH